MWVHVPARMDFLIESLYMFVVHKWVFAKGIMHSFGDNKEVKY